MMFNTKYKSSELCSFRPTYATSWKVLTSLVEEHQENVPVKFDQNPMSGCREEVVLIKVNVRSRAHTRATDRHTYRQTNLYAEQKKQNGVLFVHTASY